MLWDAPGAAAPSARLTLCGDRVELEQGEQRQAHSGDAVLEGALDDAILRAFGVEALAEVSAVLRHLRLPDEQRVQPTDATALEGRPRFHRPFGRTGRGVVSPLVWFFGRSVAIDVPGQGRTTRTLGDVARDGFDDATTSALGEELAEQVLVAARQLDPLPCMCGTGCERPHDHDAFASLARKVDPRAPIDVNATTGRCRVCGRWWTFYEAGDSHYSYRYRVSQLLVPGH